jgi:hypothetical protein
MTNDTAAPLRHPARRFYGSAMQGMLSALLWNKDRIEDPTFTGRRVLGFKLPDFQRGERWSDDQCIAFLERLWMGVSPGAYMVNWSYTNDHNHYLLLDGQQRLRALTEAEHNHFLRIPFPWLETRYTTDAQLREAYNRHNFGGTPHRPDERA